jgi:hypothetical protein
MISCALQAFWMFLLAGLGSKPYKTTTESNTVVAAFMLYSVCYSVSGYAATVTLSSCICNFFAPLPHSTPPGYSHANVRVGATLTAPICPAVGVGVPCRLPAPAKTRSRS